MRQNIIQQHDPELFQYMQQEHQRQQENIELIASENIVSPTVMACMGSDLTNKYAEGTPGHRYYGGCEHIDQIENLAINRAKALFHADHVNVQPHSGASANIAVYFGILKPGDTVLSMSLTEGGHLTHGHKTSISGQYYNFVHYGLDKTTEIIDYNSMEALAMQYKPKLIIAGASAYPRQIDFERIAQIAKKANAIFMVDMAHIAGLVATGLHPSPIPYADIITTTTHKTLRGPRGGMILCKEQFAKTIDKAVFPGIQGGPLMHIIAAKAACLYEAMQPDFQAYSQQTISNAKALASTLQPKLRLVSGGTDNHLLLIDLTQTGRTGKEVEQLLDQAHITVNKNTIPGETRSPFITSGIRVGTPAVTTRGFTEEDMRIIGNIIIDIAYHGEDAIPHATAQVKQLVARHPIMQY